MRHAFLAFCLTVAALAACAVSGPCPAQTPASTPTGGFQPLSPRAANACLNRRLGVPANVVGQVVTKYGTYYEIETQRGRTLVLADVPGLPSVPRRPDRRCPLPASVHSFR